MTNAQAITINFVSDNDIVPDDYQNALLYWRDTFSRGYFAIGDIANELCELSAIKSFPVTQQRIFDAVGKFCGKSGRTVRYYAETSTFYDDIVRSEYEELPFSHFVFARTIGGDWRSVLDFAKLSPHCSVDYLRREFCFSDNESVCAQKSVCYDSDSELDEPENIETEKILERKEPKFFRSGALSDLSDLIDRLTELLDGESGLDDTAKDELTDCLATIRRYIPVIASLAR